MLIQVLNVCKKYKRNNIEFLAVNNVSFSVGKGELVCIFGKSGCGKSTLLNIISGMIKADNGEILFNNKKITKMARHDITQKGGPKIGYVVQGHGLLDNFTLSENIALPYFLSGVKGTPDNRVNELVELVGLKYAANSFPSQLSGGEVKRGAIAAALINAPEILVVDEPTSSLDEENAKKIIEIIKNMSKNGTAIIVSTHDEKFLKVADRVYIMENGQI